MKTFIKIVVIVLSVILIVDIIASFYFYNLAIARNVNDFLKGNTDLEVSAESVEGFLEGDWRTWADGQEFDRWELKSFDDLTLQGYFLPAKQPTTKTVVFAHGYLGRGRDMALFGEYYYEELGYNMFTADARGHGASEGDYIGFGWHDRLDYVDWINLLIDKLGSDTEIVLHGLSMGAATVLMTSGEDLPDNVKVVVADSPYTNVYDLFSYQMKRMFKLPSFPILDSTSAVTKVKAGYSLREASALEQVKKTDIPVLYFHGDTDTFVPTELTQELYENTPGETELITFDEAGHGEGFVVAREKYIQNLNAFLKKYID